MVPCPQNDIQEVWTDHFVNVPDKLSNTMTNTSTEFLTTGNMPEIMNVSKDACN